MSNTRNTGFLTNIIQYTPSGNISFMSGSTTLMSISSSGAITTTGVISGSNAATASSVANLTQNVQITGSLGVTSTITAQTLSVQTITSSVSYITGSTKFGSVASNTHQFTGSMYVNSGSIGVNGPTNLGHTVSVNGAVGLYNGNTPKFHIQYMESTNGLNFAESSVADYRLFIKAGGNVGINTTDPAVKLDTNTGTISNDGYNGMRIADDASHFWFLIRKDGSGNKRFAIYNGQGSTPITLQEGGGNLGIGTGTTLPVAAVEVGVATPTFRFWNSSNSAQGSGYLLGSIVGANTYAYQNNLANEAAKIAFYSGSPWYTGEIRFYTNGTDSTATSAALRMTISQGGNIGAPSGTNIYNASDLRLKRNITTLTNGLNKIAALNPVKFNWIENYEPSEEGKDMLGFIAQEVETVIPEAVESFSTGASVHVGDLVVENPLRVNEKFLIPVLVKAIQELKAENDSLKEILQRNNIQ